jgi:hypothetical protein
VALYRTVNVQDRETSDVGSPFTNRQHGKGNALGKGGAQCPD